MKNKKKKWMINTSWTIRISRKTIDDILAAVLLTSITLAIVVFVMFVIHVCKECYIFDFSPSVIFI